MSKYNTLHLFKPMPIYNMSPHFILLTKSLNIRKSDSWQSEIYRWR